MINYYFIIIYYYHYCYFLFFYYQWSASAASASMIIMMVHLCPWRSSLWISSQLVATPSASLCVNWRHWAGARKWTHVAKPRDTYQMNSGDFFEINIGISMQKYHKISIITAVYHPVAGSKSIGFWILIADFARWKVFTFDSHWLIDGRLNNQQYFFCYWCENRVTTPKQICLKNNIHVSSCSFLSSWSGHFEGLLYFIFRLT